MKNKLTKMEVAGYKTFRDLQFEPRNLNVLIGPNGAGKSNFISLFRMFGWMFKSPPELQNYIGLNGYAAHFLHDGPRRTSQIRVGLTLETEKGLNEYAFQLSHAAKDSLIFTDEKFRYSKSQYPTLASWTSLGVGHAEPKLIKAADEDQPASNQKTARTIRSLLRRLIVYQFHDTSFNSRLRGRFSVNDNPYLKEDGGNLASFLFRMKRGDEAYYNRIVETLRLLLPFFADFVFEPENEMLLLQWRERGCDDHIFDASQASDGMLRIMALAALLGQPEQNFPDVIILDEPELGLHPHAISIISGMIKSASLHSQVILATQSPTFVDEFSPEDIIVVERRNRESTFRRLAGNELAKWMQDYALSELWDKNVIGGRPA